MKFEVSFVVLVGIVHQMTILTLARTAHPSSNNNNSNNNNNNNNFPPQTTTSSNQFLGPTFTSSFPKKILAPNTRGTLVPCTVHAKPPATVQWFWYDEVQLHKDGGTTSEVYDDVNSNWVPVTKSTSGLLDQLKNGSLLVSDFVEDSKLDKERLHVYRVVCKAWNSVGVIVSPAVHIRPVVPSQYQMYTIQLMDVFTPVGNTAVFHCTINPYFMPEFVEVVLWQEENHDVIATVGGRYSLMDHGDLRNGKLQVRNVSVSDSYKKFRCLTRNILTGKERSSNPAHLIVIEASNSPPRMTDHVSSMSATGGATVELPCVAIAIPVARYRWSKNGIPIRGGRSDDDDDDGDRISGGSMRLVGGNLLVENVQVDDSGDYRCVAENYIGHQGTSVRLSVTVPLSVHIEPQLQIVDSGKEALLRCHVYGHPLENITWLKDGKVLMTQDESGVVTEGQGGSVLRVEKVKRSDGGMYQCVVAGGGNEIVHASAQVSLGAFPPYILKGIPSEYLDPGTRVSMACSAIGNPRPTITWSVDGELLPSGQHGDRISVGDYVGGVGEVVSHVNITGAKVQDGGRYECLAANDMGEAREVATLSVYGIPHIKPMRNITALAGSELEVICRVTGYPVKEIFWKKGAQLLPTNHRQATSSNGSLLVSRLNRHLDEGWYSCHVTNPNEQGTERRFYVRVIDPPKIDPFNFPPRKQGDRVSVSCVMSSGDLPMTLEWRKDGDVIDPDLGVQVHQSGSYSSFLSIEYATPHHDGNYTCIVTNEGATTSHTSQLHINVPPTWVSEPEDTSISLSGTATIHCQAFGDPEPKVVWKKSVGGIMSSYRDIDLDGEETRLTHLGNGTLVINSVAKEDQGFYLCHASNNIAPDLSKVIHLTVHVPATFKVHDSNVSVSRGETAVMECHSEGDLPTTLNWSSSNKQPADWGHDPRYQVTYFPTDKGQGSRLTINHVTKEDSGFYVCAAKNNYGSDVTSIHLMVLQLPDAPFDFGVVVTGVEWAELRWKEGFHGNSEIVEYLVEIYREGDSWKNPVASVEVEASFRSVRVDKLRAATTYKARVKARNKVGFGEPSEVVTFDTLELEPSSPPINVSAMAVGSQSILVTWQPVPRSHENGRLLGYSVGYRRVNSTSPYLYVTVTNDNQRRIDDLEKFSTYSIHVRAFNGKGAGPMSEDVLVMTLEDVPSHAPVNVTASSQSSETISVTWSPPPLHSLNGVIVGYKVIYKYVRHDEDESGSMSQTTEQLSTTLRHLKKFTNYSVQVLARTKIGEGIASSPVYVTTLEDVPGPPEDMKVLVMNRSSIMVVWKQPLQVNGVLTRYFVNVTQLTTRKPETRVEVSPLVHNHLLTALDPDVRHVIKVGASTRLGDGKTTKEAIISTLERAGAKIAGFSRTLHFQWHNTVIIDCLVGGIPEPVVTWEKGGVVIGTRDDLGRASMTAPKHGNKLKQNHRNHNYHSDMGDRMEILRNGTLVISDIRGHDADEYKCQAINSYGLDEVTTTLIVQVDAKDAPPSPPALMVTSVTSNSIQVTWKTANNGGSKIKGFRLFKKVELDDWSFVDLDASNRSHLMTDLLCGSGYSFYIQAFNRLGMGLPSEEIKAKTEGSAPIIPPQSMILEELNSTSATLTLTTWESGGCPITSFDLSYHVADDTAWKTVQKAIPSNTTTFTVTLNPGTWYVMRVTAHNDAGSTECLLRFSTLPYMGGSTVAPQHLVRKLNDFSFFSMLQKVHVIVPAAVALVVVVVVVSVAVALYCYRKKNLKEADKVNSGLEVAMVVDDDVTGDQNENNEYENERREGKRKVKKEEQNLLKRGIPKESQSHAVSIESEREVFHVTPDLAGPGTDDDDDDGDNNHHNLQWYARIPRDGFPDGSELQTAKNSSDDLHRFKCPPSTQCSAPISPPGCTCNALDSGHSTMVTTSGRSSAGESYRMVEPYGHHNHHRHPPPPRACVLSVDRRNHPCAVQYHKERSSHEEPLVQPLFQCHPPRHKQLQIVPPVSIHGQSRCGFGCHDYHDAGSLYNQLTCTCSLDECGFSPVEIPGSGSNRISRESEISFPPPPSSDYLSQQSSGVQNTPTDSHVTSPALSEEYPGHPFYRRCDVMT